MRRSAIVTAVDGGRAKIRLCPEEMDSCTAGCAGCRGCAVRCPGVVDGEVELPSDSTIQVGDRLAVAMNEPNVAAAALLLFGFPLVLAGAGVYAAWRIGWFGAGGMVLGGIAGLAIAWGVARWADRAFPGLSRPRIRLLPPE